MQIVPHQCVQVRTVIVRHQLVCVAAAPGLDVGGELPADIQLMPGLEPVIQQCERLQITYQGLGFKIGQFRVKLKPERKVDGLPAAFSTQVSQLVYQILDHAQSRHCERWSHNL